jgi:hypothetical protein
MVYNSNNINKTNNYFSQKTIPSPVLWQTHKCDYIILKKDII